MTTQTLVRNAPKGRRLSPRRHSQRKRVRRDPELILPASVRLNGEQVIILPTAEGIGKFALRVENEHGRLRALTKDEELVLAVTPGTRAEKDAAGGRVELPEGGIAARTASTTLAAGRSSSGVIATPAARRERRRAELGRGRSGLLRFPDGGVRIVSRARRDTKYCAADPGPMRHLGFWVPDQRMHRSASLRAAPHPGNVTARCAAPGETSTRFGGKLTAAAPSAAPAARARDA